MGPDVKGNMEEVDMERRNKAKGIKGWPSLHHCIYMAPTSLMPCFTNAASGTLTEHPCVHQD